MARMYIPPTIESTRCPRPSYLDPSHVVLRAYLDQWYKQFSSTQMYIPTFLHSSLPLRFIVASLFQWSLIIQTIHVDRIPYHSQSVVIVYYQKVNGSCLRSWVNAYATRVLDFQPSTVSYYYPTKATWYSGRESRNSDGGTEQNPHPI